MRLHPGASAGAVRVLDLGPVLYAGLYEDRRDLAEVYRRLAYALQGYWDENDENLQPLFRAYRFGAGALVAQILSLVALVSGTIL